MYFAADVQVKTTFLARLVIDTENEEEVERFFMEDADFNYDEFEEIGVPTITVKNIKKFNIRTQEEF